MIPKIKEKEEAISLRKTGLSYNEILSKIPVSKSTLSLWLREIGLAKKQKQRLTEKKRAAQKKAQEACRKARIAKESGIINLAKTEIKNITKRELWLIGITVYWAEGTKQKENNVSQRVSFGNSDPRMILLFLKWLNECCNISSDKLYFCIYIHENANIEKAKAFWSNLICINVDNVYLKKHNPKTKRRNQGENYYGLLRIEVRSSTDLNRKIKGWISGINENF